MPAYAKRAYKKNYKKSFSANTPVSKAISKYKRPSTPRTNTRQYTANNRNAIMTIAAQVKSLQLSRLGMYQKRTEQLNWQTSDAPSLAAFDLKKPLAFCLNQFNGRDTATGQNLKAPVYSTNTDGTGKVFERFGTWVPSALVGTARSLNPHIADQDDVVSPECYKPLGTSIKFEFTFEDYPANKAQSHMRIDVIRPRKVLLDSPFHDLTMPKGIGQFTGLCERDMVNRNFINPTYWEVVQTKWIPVSNNSGVAKNITKLVTINRSYKTMPIIKTDLNSTSSGMLPGTITYPNFYQSVDPRLLEWCIVSCGDVAPIRMTMLRQISWRDQNGTAA